MSYGEIPNRELVVYALYLLGGDSKFIHTEEIALRCFELFPASFSWIKYPQYPDKDVVRVALTDARKETYGILVEGRAGQNRGLSAKTQRAPAADGWILTDQGRRWIRANLASLEKVAGTGQTKAHRQVLLRQLKRIRDHVLFSHYRENPSGFSPTIGTIADMLRCRVDAEPAVWKERFDKISRQADAARQDDVLVSFLKAGLKDRTELALENLALRQQLAILKRNRPHARLKRRDRLFWACLSSVWLRWRESLIVVKPETAVRWHRKGFALYWTHLSKRGRTGRSQTGQEIRILVRKMADANPTWGSPRIHGELQKLGIKISERTVARLMPKKRNPPSQTWRTFLDNHVKDLVSIDFFVVPTATFRVLFVLVVLAHHRRRVVHFNVTAHPTARWTGEQIIQAFPDGSEPRYLLRDRDRIFGEDFQERIRAIGIKEVITTPQSPWQNPFCERLIGSIRRDCLDHVIILGESHLRKVLARYFHYYHKYRTHLSLEKDAPEPRPIQAVNLGEIIEIPEVGGLHHHYERHAA